MQAISSNCTNPLQILVSKVRRAQLVSLKLPSVTKDHMTKLMLERRDSGSYTVETITGHLSSNKKVTDSELHWFTAAHTAKTTPGFEPYIS